MSTGDRYVVEDTLDSVVAQLEESSDFFEVPGLNGREDFFVNVAQIVSVFPGEDA
jgi:hypothetical protein